MKCKKVLIAGGTGFIGSRVVEHLSSSGDYACYVITRNTQYNKSGVTPLYIDLSIPNEVNVLEDLADYGPFDYGIYLAANIPKIGERKESLLDANYSTLVPLINFLELFSQSIDKLIYASSIDVVGIPETENYDEEAPLKPKTPYAIAKLCGEYYVSNVCSNLGKTYNILRFSQVYGPHEPLVRVIPILLSALKTNKEFSLYGSGNEKRRYLYVEDAVSSIVQSINSTGTADNQIFNIAGEEACSINDLLEISQSVFNKEMNIKRVDYIGPTFDNIPDITKAKECLGFFPRYSMRQGLQEIYRNEV